MKRRRRHITATTIALFTLVGGCVEAPADQPPPSHPASHPASQPGEIAHYTCSMHPSVKQAGPGSCPICSMALTPVTKDELSSGTILVDTIRRQRIGLRTERVERRPLQRRLRTVGTVAYDETLLADVNPRMSGWIQKLYVDETGQRVTRGQTLFLLYSPELYAAQIEHLSVVSRSAMRPETSQSLALASRRRLNLLGVSDSQISALERNRTASDAVPVRSPADGFVIEKNLVEGARVEAGARVYRIADLRRVWIEAKVYEADLSLVRVGHPVTIALPYDPNVTRLGTIDFVHPTLDEKTRTTTARIVLENADLTLRPGMYADVEIEVELGERLSVPKAAVIYTGPRRLVFVDLSEGRLLPKVVKLGVHAGAYVEVVHGLDEGDVVVTSGNFLIAAESRIRSATKYWGGDDAAE